MTEPTSTNGETSGQAFVPWSDLWPDLTLIAVAVQVMVLSFVIDICAGHRDYFSRSGAIAVLMSGILAYGVLRSITKRSSIAGVSAGWPARSLAMLRYAEWATQHRRIF